MRTRVYRTLRGCCSDEITDVLQDLINNIYVKNDIDECVDLNNNAKSLILKSSKTVYGFLKNLVGQMEEDEALALLAEIDHKLTYPTRNFVFDYSVSDIGSSNVPYTMFLRYGDDRAVIVKMTVNDISQ